MLGKSLLSVLGRVASAGAVFLSVALVARIFSKSEFGLWMILQAIFLIGQNFDWGLRFGLGIRLAALGGKEFSKESETLYFSTFNFLLLSSAILAVAIGIGALFLPWDRLLSVAGADLRFSLPLFMGICLGLIILAVPMMMTYTIFLSTHDANMATLCNGVSPFLLLGVLYACSHWLSFFGCGIAYFAANVGIWTIATAGLWARRKWDWQWGNASGRMQVLRPLWKASIQFFFLSVIAALVTGLGSFISGNVFGLAKSADFSVLQRLFSIPIIVHFALMNPMGPEITRLAARSDWDLIGRQKNRLVFAIWPILFILGGGILWGFHPLILKLWTGLSFENYSLAGLLWLWVVISGLANTKSFILNSLGAIRSQCLMWIILAVPFCVIPFWLAQKFGNNGLAIGLIGCQMAFAAWCAVALRAVLGRKQLIL